MGAGRGREPACTPLRRHSTLRAPQPPSPVSAPTLHRVRGSEVPRLSLLPNHTCPQVLQEYMAKLGASGPYQFCDVYGLDEVGAGAGGQVLAPARTAPLTFF